MSGYPWQLVPKHVLSELPGRYYVLANMEKASHLLPHPGPEYFLCGRSRREQQVLDDEDRKADLPSQSQWASLWQETVPKGLEDGGKK